MGLKTTVDFIPAGTLLFSENSLFQRIPKQGRREKKAAWRQRLNYLVSNTMNQQDREIFVNFRFDPTRGADDIESRIKMNAGIDEDEGLTCAYRYLNFLNHSCRPNCRVVDRGTEYRKERWELRSLVPIYGLGTELTIDYDAWPCGDEDTENLDVSQDLLQDVSERRRVLKRLYSFDCECDACTDPNTDRMRDEIRTLQTELLESDSGAVTAARVDAGMDKYISLLMEQRLYHIAQHAHRRAIEVYHREGRVDDGVNDVDRSDLKRELDHRLQLIGVRRILFGPKDKEIKTIIEEYTGARRTDGESDDEAADGGGDETAVEEGEEENGGEGGGEESEEDD
jgi:hypothetical protein